jgi:hypothetical protein
MAPLELMSSDITTIIALAAACDPEFPGRAAAYAAAQRQHPWVLPRKRARELTELGISPEKTEALLTQLRDNPERCLCPPCSIPALALNAVIRDLPRGTDFERARLVAGPTSRHAFDDGDSVELVSFAKLDSARVLEARHHCFGRDTAWYKDRRTPHQQLDGSGSFESLAQANFVFALRSSDGAVAALAFARPAPRLPDHESLLFDIPPLDSGGNAVAIYLAVARAPGAAVGAGAKTIIGAAKILDGAIRPTLHLSSTPAVDLFSTLETLDRDYAELLEIWDPLTRTVSCANPELQLSGREELRILLRVARSREFYPQVVTAKTGRTARIRELTRLTTAALVEHLWKLEGGRAKRLLGPVHFHYSIGGTYWGTSAGFAPDDLPSLGQRIHFKHTFDLQQAKNSEIHRELSQQLAGGRGPFVWHRFG